MQREHMFEWQVEVPGPGARVFEVRHESSGLHAFVALHDTSRGPALGGIRRRAYRSEDAALKEVQQLAEAMSFKTRLAGLPCGGAKTIILDSKTLDVPAAYRVLGEVIEEQGGSYLAGPDMGTGPDELAWVRQTTKHVNAISNDASAATARGVLAGLDAALAFRGLDLRGETAVVQGLGGVGFRVALGLHERGAKLIVSEPRKTVIGELERAIGAPVTAIPTAACASTPALVYSPCAVGGVITGKNIETLGAKVICGAANLQLAVDTYDRALIDIERTLWVPDILVNAGAVIEGFWAAQRPEMTRAELDAAIDAIGPRTTRLLETACARGISPAVLARLQGRHYGDDSLA